MWVPDTVLWSFQNFFPWHHAISLEVGSDQNSVYYLREIIFICLDSLFHLSHHWIFVLWIPTTLLSTGSWLYLHYQGLGLRSYSPCPAFNLWNQKTEPMVGLTCLFLISLKFLFFLLTSSVWKARVSCLSLFFSPLGSRKEGEGISSKKINKISVTPHLPEAEGIFLCS